jgi:hypothetical protein
MFLTYLHPGDLSSLEFILALLFYGFLYLGIPALVLGLIISAVSKHVRQRHETRDGESRDGME